MKINLTNKAKEELIKIRKEKQTDKPLRIYIAGYGWGGPSFGIALDEHKDGDLVTQIDDLTFLLEKDFAESFDIFTVDYNDGFLRKGFTVLPNGLASSGC